MPSHAKSILDKIAHDAKACIGDVGLQEAQTLTAHHTSFASFFDIIADQNYRPSFQTSHPDLCRLADLYDVIQFHRNDPRRAFRYNPTPREVDLGDPFIDDLWFIERGHDLKLGPQMSAGMPTIFPLLQLCGHDGHSHDAIEAAERRLIAALNYTRFLPVDYLMDIFSANTLIGEQSDPFRRLSWNVTDQGGTLIVTHCAVTRGRRTAH
jgi:hypothetical protein